MKKIFFILVLNSFLFGAEFNQAMQEYINTLKIQAKAENPNFVDFDAKNGELIFSTKNKGKNNELISCQSCHNVDLTKKATNIFTNKQIQPLTPSVNKNRLSDVKEVKKWLKRNLKMCIYAKETLKKKVMCFII